MSTFIPWWWDKIEGVILIFLYLWRWMLCPNMCYILVKIPWTAEKTLFCRVWVPYFIDTWQVCVLYGVIQCPHFSFSFCLDDMSTVESRILKLPTITLSELIFGSLYKIGCTCVCNICDSNCDVLMIDCSLISMQWSPLSLLISLDWKSILSDIRITLLFIS